MGSCEKVGNIKWLGWSELSEVVLGCGLGGSVSRGKVYILYFWSVGG